MRKGASSDFTSPAREAPLARAAPHRYRAGIRSLRSPVAVVVLTLLLAAGCSERHPPTPLVPSTWGGTMRYLEHDYAFTLVITEVEGDGEFHGSIDWTTFGTSSPISGEARGAHLTFVDVDRDVKDVTLAGREMHGTDKNGMATFDAQRTDAEPQPREVPTVPALPVLPLLPLLPAMNPAWARRAAVCERLKAETMKAACVRAAALPPSP